MTTFTYIALIIGICFAYIGVMVVGKIIIESIADASAARKKAREDHMDELKRCNAALEQINANYTHIYDRLGKIDVLNDKVVVIWNRLGDIQKLLENENSENKQ